MTRSRLDQSLLCCLFVFVFSTLLLVGCKPSVEDRLDEIRALQAAGQIGQSIPLLQELIDSGHRDGEILYRYGRAISLSGLPGRAVWALDAAMDDPEWLVRAAYQLASDANRSDNFDFALEVLRRLRNERTDSHDEDLPARLLEARVLLSSRRFYAEALEQVETILDDFPDEEEAIRLKAAALLGLKETDEAYELIREAGLMAGEVPADSSADADTTDDEVDLDLDIGVADVNSREAYWCVVRASFKREAGEPKEAAQIVDECLEKYPTKPELINEALTIHTQLRRYDRILEILRTAHEESPDNGDFRKALVQHLTAIGLGDEAESILRAALEQAKADENSPPTRIASLWIDLGGYLIEQGRTAEGLDAFDAGIELLGDNASPELLFRQAEALILEKRYDEAIEIANKTPIEVHAPMIRGRVAFERGEYETAIEELDRAALLWPDNAPIRYYLARAAEGLGEFDRAIEEYRQAIRADGTLSAARERLLRLHLAEGRVRQAEAIYWFVSPRQRSDASLGMRLLAIEMQARLGNEPDLSIPADADMPLVELQRHAIDALGRGVSLRNGVEGAVQLLATLEEQVDSASRGIFVREQVDLLLDDEETQDQAISIARRAKNELPRSLDVDLALGRALVRKGVELDEAETLLRSVLERDPQEVEALASLGDLAARRDRDVEAMGFYDRAIALEPENWQAVSGRIAALTRAGRATQATRELEDYLASAAPYDGRAALALANRLDANEENRSRRIELARRALRFGAGAEALQLLTSLDPEAAAELRPSAAGTPAEDPEPSA